MTRGGTYQTKSKIAFALSKRVIVFISKKTSNVSFNQMENFCLFMKSLSQLLTKHLCVFKREKSISNLFIKTNWWLAVEKFINDTTIENGKYAHIFLWAKLCRWIFYECNLNAHNTVLSKIHSDRQLFVSITGLFKYKSKSICITESV